MKKLLIGSLTILACFGSVVVLADPDKPRVFQAAQVQPNALNGSTAEGAAWLKRSKNKVEGQVAAKVGMAGAPYTVWWVFFNNPSACLSDCGMADLMADGGAAADVAIFHASGVISASDGWGGGVINVDISAIGGERAGVGAQDAPAPLPFFQRAMKKNNGMCAEIHLDINDHPVVDNPVNWVGELTYPENNTAFAVFLPPEGCNE